MKLKGKVAVVTGSSKGIGRAIALDLAKNGCKVVINCSSSKREAEKVLKEVNKLSEGIFVKADVSKEKDVEKLVSRTVDKFSGIDILVNNAGIWLKKPIEETSLDEYDRLMNINVKGTFLMIKSCLPHLKKQKESHIINMASDSSYGGFFGESAYAATKGGIVGMSKVLRKELWKYGIKVTYINPGRVNTWNDPRPERLMKPGDVGKLVVDILTSDANFLIERVDIQPLNDVMPPSEVD